MKRASTRLVTGISRDRYGYRVIWRDAGRQREKRFPLDTPLDQLKAWRTRKRQQAREVTKTGQGGSLTRDVVRFLRQRRTLASFKADRAHLRAWLRLFPRRARLSLTRADVQHAIASWRETGYSPKEIRHRVAILRQLFWHVDGSTHPTPCDDVPIPSAPTPRPVSVAPDTVRAVAVNLRRNECVKYLRDAKTRARYLVLATTGQRPAQLARTQPMDVDLERRIWFVRPAKGDRGTIVYLNDDMLAAWTLFVAAKAWGQYDRRSFVKTLRRNGWPKGVRPYNLRHTVGLTLSELGVDLGDIQAHMGHASPATTRLFYVPGTLPRLRAASQQLDGRIAVVSAQLPATPASSARGRSRKPLDWRGLSAQAGSK